MAEQHLLIFGASARAAAFSALRAGLSPWCADLFGDADLAARCPVVALPDTYPDGLLEIERRAPLGPFLYTGGLENRPRLLRELAQRRTLWGVAPAMLARVRRPERLAALVAEARLFYPLTRREPPEKSERQWLLKPRNSSGGVGIRFWGPESPLRRGMVVQEYLKGPSFAAVYLGDGRRANLLGVTHQLTGEPWLHAARFQYCGSISSAEFTAEQYQVLERLGAVLTTGWQLRGLFGIDGILHDGKPWLVEVNPRYTASVEVLEYALGLPALALHRRVFDPQAPGVTWTGQSRTSVVGKVILFARGPLIFPASGPWRDTLEKPGPLDRLPDYADIPHAGQRIAAGHPILTLFGSASTTWGCRDELRRRALDLDRYLYRA